MEERLQKVLARAGIASRRKAEEMISAGLVSVNGKILTTLGDKADPRRDRIVVQGRPLPPLAPPRHFLLYKPKGVVSTLSDPEGRPTIADLLPRGGRRKNERLYPVGRLDFASEGLLLITNDGDLAFRVLRASSALPKTYWVKVSGRPSEEHLAKLRRGIFLPPLRSAPAVRTAPAQVRWRPGKPGDPNPWLEIVLTEGRPNQIRRMMQAVGHRVEKLRRVQIGPLQVAGLQPGELRPLAPPELAALRAALRPGATNRRSAPAAPPAAAPLRRGRPSTPGAPNRRGTHQSGPARGRAGRAPRSAAERPRSPHPGVRGANGRRDAPRFAAGRKPAPPRGRKPNRGARSRPASGRR